MPRNRDGGRPGRPARPAPGSARSPRRGRRRGRAARRCRARSARPVSASTVAAHRGQQLAQLVARLGGAARPARHGHLAAGDQRGGEERRGAGQVRLDVQAAAASRPGSTAQTSGSASSTPAPAARSIWTVIRRCGALGTGGPTWRTTMPRSKSGAGQQQAGDELAGRGRVDASPRRRGPGRCRARSAAGRRWAGGRRRRRARAAPRSAAPSGRSRARGSPSKVTGPSASAGHRRQEPHDRAGQADVDVGRAAQRPRPDHPQLVVDSGHLSAHGAQAGGHQLGVAGPQRVAQRAGADRARRRAPAPGRSSTSSRAGGRCRVTGRAGGRARARATPTGRGRSAAGGVRARDPFCRSPERADCTDESRPVRRGRYVGHVRAVRDDAQLGRSRGAVRRGRRDRRRARARLQRGADRPGADRAGVGPYARTAVLCVARWGLVPAWAATSGGAARMINARAETVATSRAFAPSFAERRCLVPADGWYEWVRLAGRRQAGVLHDPAGRRVAGLRRHLVGVGRRARGRGVVTFSVR